MNTLLLGDHGSRRLGWNEVGSPSGIPVIHCHGGLSCRLESRFADRICKRHGVRWITADRPGIGASDIQPGRKLMDWAEDMAALADHLQLGRFAVSGWSAGGPYALACGAVLGRRVTRIATLAGMAPLRQGADIRALGMATDRFLFRVSPRSPRLAALGLSAARQAPSRLLRASIARMLANGPDAPFLPATLVDQVTASFSESLRPGGLGTARDYGLLAADWGFSPDQITSPVSLWHGRDDTLLPFDHATRLQAMLPSASLQALPGVGHFLLQRCLDDVLDELMTG
ncbi:alpha/beta fold hydrolase [Alcanivorax hongdengensis]|uniref:alpha/beta fold hydrolase n=1 Tax=Alcanivorax hongdengensis TaxID=519051 RepID=UPI0012F9CC3E|nr:alpha/beta hydrolase [Alcanivorax hongdengensis]